MAMTTNDVPTACWMGNPTSMTSAGTMRKPPPTPRMPVSRPTAAPDRTIFHNDRCSSSTAAGGRRRMSNRPMASISAAKATIRKSGERRDENPAAG